MTWRYCDKDVGVQDTVIGDWDWDARELRLKQVAGTRAGVRRDTGDQDMQDQERDTTRPRYRGRCMKRWEWGLRRPGSAPGEPEHRASGQGHGELRHRGTGTSTGTWRYQDTGGQDRNIVLGQGLRRPGPRAGDEEQETGNRTSV